MNFEPPTSAEAERRNELAVVAHLLVEGQGFVDHALVGADPADFDALLLSARHCNDQAERIIVGDAP